MLFLSWNDKIQQDKTISVRYNTIGNNNIITPTDCENNEIDVFVFSWMFLLFSCLAALSF